MTMFSDLSCCLTYESGRFKYEQTMSAKFTTCSGRSFSLHVLHISKEDFSGLFLLFFGGLFFTSTVA